MKRIGSPSRGLARAGRHRLPSSRQALIGHWSRQPRQPARMARKTPKAGDPHAQACAEVRLSGLLSRPVGQQRLEERSTAERDDPTCRRPADCAARLVDIARILRAVETQPPILQQLHHRGRIYREQLKATGRWGLVAKRTLPRSLSSQQQSLSRARAAGHRYSFLAMLRAWPTCFPGPRLPKPVAAPEKAGQTFEKRRHG